MNKGEAVSQQRLIGSPEKTKQRIAHRGSRADSARLFHGEIQSPVLQLQRTLGNRRVAQLIKAKRLTPQGEIIGLQQRLNVGAGADRYEQEADRVARQVMTTPDAVAANSMRAMSPEEDKEQKIQTKPLAKSITPIVQRQMGIEDEEAKSIHGKFGGSLTDSFEAGDDVETQVSQSKGRGNSLPDHVRAYMEPRFGVDFSHVRVHTGSDAIQMNRDVGAQAFTHGSEIYFGEGHSPTNLELTAHELTHVVQQTGGVPLQTKRQEEEVPPPGPESSIQRICAACAADDRDKKGIYPRGLSMVSVQTLQRDLATPPPAVPATAQPDLTPAQIQAAIAFNRARYNKTSTRLIQNLLGGPVTGVWTEENIEAIAATQQEYGFKKDGMVGPKFFRFLDEEVRREKLNKTDKNCLLAFRVISSPPTIGPVAGGSRSITGQFRVHAQFSKHCGCADYEYRQFIRGHWRRERAGIQTDLGGTFTTQPAGRLNAAFDEDGNTTAAALNYGHRAQPAEAINHYLDDTGTEDQANGCIYESEDTPGGPDTVLPGDIFDIDVNFRGEIQRNGRVVRTLQWSAIRGRFPVP